MGFALNGTQQEAAGATLRRAARELRKVIHMVEDLEEVVGLTLRQGPRPPREQMLELQKLDHVQQKILGVSDFLEALCLDMAEHWLVNPKRASQCVLLADLGAKLADASAECVPRQEEAREPVSCEPDAYELF